jgi:hypothetical protein
MNDDTVRTPETPEVDDFEVEDTEGENEGAGDDSRPVRE